MDSQQIAHVKQQIDAEYRRIDQQQYPEGIPPSFSIAAGRYTDPRFFELEKKHLWSKSWLIAGCVDELPEVGSYKLWSHLDMPVVLVRGKDKNIRAFFNICRHRGTALVNKPSGKTKVLTCPFHGWVYDLQGKLNFVTEEYEFPTLDKSANGLVPLRCELWGNFIFINRDMNAEPLLQSLGQAAVELDHFDFHKRGVTTILPYELPCNWKVMVDAFMESYHTPTTHRQSLAGILDARGSVIEMWARGHSSLMVPRRRGEAGKQTLVLDSNDAKELDPRHEITRAGNISLMLFPNIIASCGEFEFPLITIWPTSINTTHVDIIIAEQTNARRRPEVIETMLQQLSVVMDEDMSNVASVQKSLESGVMEAFHLGAPERRIFHFNEHLDSIIGVNNIPPELRMSARIQ